MKELEDKQLEKEGRTEIFMKKIAEAEVPELSVSIEESDDDDANSVDSVQEPKSNVSNQDGEEIPPVELPASDDGRCTNLSCLLNSVLDNIQEIVA